MIKQEVEDWFSEIENGLDYRNTFGIESSWNRLERLFYNRAESSALGGPNIIQSTGDALMSALNVPAPAIKISARKSDAIATARIVESVDNLMLEQLNFKGEIEEMSLCTYLYGTGILKFGYDSEFGYDSRFDVGTIMQPGSGLKLGMTLNQHDKQGNLIEFSNIKPGMPWVKNVLPHDFVVPWGTRNIEEAPWCVHRIVRHIDDVRADPRYKTKGLEPIMSMKDFVKSYESSKKSYRLGVGQETLMHVTTQDAPYVELWEIRDRRTGEMLVVATGYDKFLYRDLDVFQRDGLPFVSLNFVPRSRTFWVTPDAYYLECHQNELTDISLQRAKNRRISVLKLLYGDDAFEETELEKLLSPEVGAAIKVNLNGSDDIRSKVVTFQAQANPAIAMEEENVRRNAREEVGFGRNQLGEYESSGRRSATEASVVSQAANLRMDRRQGRLATVYKNGMRKVNSIIFQFWTAPRAAEILDQGNAQRWVTYNGPSLLGDYAYKVEFTIDNQETIAARKQQALGMYQLLRQDPYVDPFLLSQYVADAYNDPSFTRMFLSKIEAITQLNAQQQQVQMDQQAQLQMQQEQQAVQAAKQQGGGNGKGSGKSK